MVELPPCSYSRPSSTSPRRLVQQCASGDRPSLTCPGALHQMPRRERSTLLTFFASIDCWTHIGPLLMKLWLCLSRWSEAPRTRRSDANSGAHILHQQRKWPPHSASCPKLRFQSGEGGEDTCIRSNAQLLELTWDTQGILPRHALKTLPRAPPLHGC